MKNKIHILLLAAFAMAAAACTEKDPMNKNGSEQEEPATTKTVTLSLGSDWEDGDKFGFFTDADADINSSIIYKADETEYTLNVAVEATELYAYYPWSAGNNNKTAQTVRLYVHEEQIQTAAGVLNGINYPMAAKAAIEGTGADIKLKPVACALSMNVFGASFPDEKVKSITFSSSLAVAGTAITDMPAETVSYMSSSTAATVTLDENAFVDATGSEPAGADGSKSIYLVVAKQNYTDSQIIVTTTIQTYVFTLTEAIDCTAEDILTLDLNLKDAEVPGYNYYKFLGNYRMRHMNNGVETTWIWNLAMHPTEENTYTVSFFEPDGSPTYDNSIIRLDYSDTGEAPMLKFPLPQRIYADSQVDISSTTSDGYQFLAAFDGGNGYNLVYDENSETEKFDFVTNGFSKGNNWTFLGLCLYQKKEVTGGSFDSIWNWIVPCNGEDCLSIVKTDEAIFDLKEQYNFDFTAETVNIKVMPGFEITGASSSADWLHVETTQTGLTFTADENRTDSERDGTVTFTASNGETYTTSVKQTTYESLLGVFNIYYKDQNGNEKVKTMNFQQGVRYETYSVLYNEGDFIYTINVENKNGVLTIQSGQLVRDDFTYIWSGSLLNHVFDFYLRPAKTDFSLLWLGTGYAFELAYSKDGDAISYDFVPDKALKEANPDARGFTLTAYYAESEAQAGNVAFTWELLAPRDGETYIRMTKQ